MRPLPSGVAAFLVVGGSACDSATAPREEPCPDPVAGTYELVSFDGKMVPARFSGQTCLNFWCSPHSFEITSGEITLREDGVLQESGISRNLRSDHAFGRRLGGTYVAQGSRVAFTYDVDTSAGQDSGECIDVWLRLTSPFAPFYYEGQGWLHEPTRFWRKRG
jgi:hypothetical protein